MASSDDRAATPLDLDGSGLRVGLIRARWNDDIVSRLVDGAQRELHALEVAEVVEVSVPGSFELPFAARGLARSGLVDSVVCIGVIIRGETSHYELVSESCARGLQDVQIDTGVPVAFGVLAVEDRSQARARSEGPGGHNVGEEAARVAVEMARLRDRFDPREDRRY